MRTLERHPGWLREALSPLVRAVGVLVGTSWKDMLLSTDGWKAEPAFALESHTDRYVLKAIIPGGDAPNLAVTADHGELRISGVMQLHFADGKSLDYVREEPLDERFKLPPDADAAHLKFVYHHAGMLRVTIPRHETIEAVAAAAAPAGEAATSPTETAATPH